MPSKQINTYRLNITQGLWVFADIGCYFNGSYQGSIYFSNANAVKDPVVDSNGNFKLYYPIERLDSIVSLIREEDPVYIQIWGTTTPYCRVTTSNAEPVGEEEGS